MQRGGRILKASGPQVDAHQLAGRRGFEQGHSDAGDKEGRLERFLSNYLIDLEQGE